MLLARNLCPEDFGVVGIAMIVTGFVGQFSDIGLVPALVQRRNLDEKLLQTAQVLNLILSCVLFICAEATTPFLRTIFDNPEVPSVVSVLALSLLISAIGFLPSALLTREMQFARLRMPGVVGVSVKGIIAVSCALAGLKYWSLVAATLASGLVSAVLLRMVRPCKIRWRLDREISLELLKYGAPLLGMSVLVFSLFNIDNFMIGSRMGTVELGYYTIAFTWSSYVCSLISETVNSVLFPQFARMQSNRGGIAEMYGRSLRGIFFISVMVNATLFAIAEGFLFTVLGKGTPRWLPALYPLQILCVYGVIRTAVEPIGNIIMAFGRTKLLLWANLLAFVPQICLLPTVIKKWGLPGVACLVCAAYSVQWVLYGPFLARELGINTWRFLKLISPAIFAGACGVLISRVITPNDSLSWRAIILRSITLCASFVLIHELITLGSITGEITRLLRKGSTFIESDGT
jgi:O-antigen/teichoic acid export membrane protein